jgi:hypothetical protein
MLEPLVIVRIVSSVRKVSVCCGGSQICSGGGGGGLVSSLFCWFVLFGVGYVRGYVICGASRGYVICRADKGCR